MAIYLIQEREFIRLNENTYKLGKTRREGLTRYNNYPKGSELLIQIKCDNCDDVERKLINLFKEKYKQYIDYGYEYFNGNSEEMIDDIYNCVKALKIQSVSETPETVAETTKAVSPEVLEINNKNIKKCNIPKYNPVIDFVKTLLKLPDWEININKYKSIIKNSVDTNEFDYLYENYYKFSNLNIYTLAYMHTNLSFPSIYKNEYLVLLENNDLVIAYILNILIGDFYYYNKKIYKWHTGDCLWVEIDDDEAINTANKIIKCYIDKILTDYKDNININQELVSRIEKNKDKILAKIKPLKIFQKLIDTKIKFDKNSLIPINNNKVIDLQTKEITDRTRYHYFTYYFPCNYVNADKCDAILKEIFKDKDNFQKNMLNFISVDDTGDYKTHGNRDLLNMLKKIFNCQNDIIEYRNKKLYMTITDNKKLDIDINELFSWIITTKDIKKIKDIDDFVDEHISFDVSYPGIYGQQLYNYYLDWCELKNIIPLSNTKFGLEFTKIYYRNGFIKKQTSPVLYVGIKKI